MIPFPVVFASFLEPKGSLLSREKRRETRKSKRLAWPISRRYCIETDRLHTTRAKEIRFKFRVLETRSLGRRNPGMRISSIQTRHPDVSNGVRVVSSRWTFLYLNKLLPSTDSGAPRWNQAWLVEKEDYNAGLLRFFTRSNNCATNRLRIPAILWKTWRYWSLRVEFLFLGYRFFFFNKNVLYIVYKMYCMI